MATESAVVNGHAAKVPPNACAHTYTPGLLSRPSLQGATANGEMQNCPSVENKRLTPDMDINSLSPTEAKGMSEKGSQEGCESCKLGKGAVKCCPPDTAWPPHSRTHSCWDYVHKAHTKPSQSTLLHRWSR